MPHLPKPEKWWWIFPPLRSRRKQEEAGRSSEQSRAERETADLMMNYMITCSASELSFRWRITSRAGRGTGPPPLLLLPPFLHPTPPQHSLPTPPTTITRTDVCCNPVAPFAVDTWMRHLDRNAAPLQIRESLRVRAFVCVNVNESKSWSLD